MEVKIVLVNNDDFMMLNFRGVFMKTLVEKGHEVYCCAPAKNAEVVQKIEQLGVKFCHVDLDRAGKNPFKDFKTLKALFFFFKKQKPDLVFNYTIKPIIYGSCAARLAGVRNIYSMIAGLGYVFLGKSFLNYFVSRLYKIVLPLNKKIFFLNPDDLDFIAGKKLLPREQAALLPGEGVDLGQFACKPLPESQVSFLLVARMLKDKGVGEYVDAARIVKEKHPNTAFYLVGPTDENPHSFKKHEIEAWIQEGVIEYKDFTNNVVPWFEKSSVFVLPSYYREGVPRTILEAMAVGRPIITTNMPGCRETVVVGENGFLVPIKDSQRLAEVMEKFVLNPELLKKMSKRSREMVEEKFEIHKVNKEIFRVMNLPW